MDPTAIRYNYDLQQGYRIGNSYATTIVGVSYVEPQYIFTNPPRTVKCNIKQPITSNNVNPAVLGVPKMAVNDISSNQTTGITRNCDRLKNFGDKIIGF